MKKLTLEATDENVLNSIADDKLHRSADVKDFINMLETIDYNAFISLDAAWGEGKTFFVRQAEMTLRYHTKKILDKEILTEEENAFMTNTVLGEMKLEHTYLPIYFNAWLYDNNDDPLMSLLFLITKKCSPYISTKIDIKSVREKICLLLSSVKIKKEDVELSVDAEKINSAFSKENILGDILTAEEIQGIVKDVFNDIIVEEAQRLVIFIDELDRCRPSYAIEMLERIKHYFDDDRIVFVMSVNKAQLVHTISNCYGDGFDSSDYLNKFFDISLQLPPVDTTHYFRTLGIDCSSGDWITKIANELRNYYNLSLRNTTRYYQRINTIKEIVAGRFNIGGTLLYMLLVPIICILEITDVQKKNEILSGNGIDILKKIVNEIDAPKTLIIRLTCSGNYEDTSENYEKGMKELENVYEFIFKQDISSGWYEGGVEINASFKRELLKICNSI